MKTIYINFFLFLAICIRLVLSAEDVITEADRLFDATLFDAAIPLYKKILPELSEENASGVKLRIAQALIINHNDEEASQILKTLSDSPGTEERFYLLGLAYKRMGKYEMAIDAFKAYLHKQPPLEFEEEAGYELGAAYYQLKKKAEAKNAFARLTGYCKNKELYTLSQIHIAKMALDSSDPQAADSILAALEVQAESATPLVYEIAFYRGQALYQKGEYLPAVQFFERALPMRHPEMAVWYADALEHLGNAYARLAEASPHMQQKYYEMAEKSFQKILSLKSDEHSHLAYIQFLTKKYRHAKDASAFQEAQKLLAKQEIFITPEGRAHALFLGAELANGYSEKDIFYRKLTQNEYKDTTFFSIGWYMRGLNDFQEAQLLAKTADSIRSYEKAASSLRHAVEILQEINPRQAALALKMQAQVHSLAETPEGYQQAYKAFEELIEKPVLLEALEDPGEIFYLFGLTASHLAETENDLKYSQMMDKILTRGITAYPKSPYRDRMHLLLAGNYFTNKEYTRALEAYEQLAALIPPSPLAGEAYFWAVRCLEALNESPEKCKKYRRKIFEEYPQIPCAAEAYFSFYPYIDYLQGDRSALKHLQGLKEKFPDSPYLINAYYLIGMDFKRDRKTAEGKWIRRKNMNEVIDALQASENTFNSLYERGLLPEKEMGYFVNVRYRSTLERALANLSISEESQGAKQQIFLEYAEDVFKEINQDLISPQHPLAKYLVSRDPIHPILEESSYWLAQTYIRLNNDGSAEKVLNEMLDKYRSSKITRGYYLSRVWYDLGMIAMRQANYTLALRNFANAADAAKGKILSTDQKIDLWIQESICHREMKDMDKAMLVLSQAINDDAISSLRVKAMYLRAEIYELQGRQELSRKQLEATSKKGGEWALKAKQKLDAKYGYQ